MYFIACDTLIICIIVLVMVIVSFIVVSFVHLVRRSPVSCSKHELVILWSWSWVLTSDKPMHNSTCYLPPTKVRVQYELS